MEAAERVTGCPKCRYGLIDPPPFFEVGRTIIEVRAEQERAGLLTYCDCEVGQRMRGFYTAKLAEAEQAEREREAARRGAMLLRIDGLKPHERTITWERIGVGKHNQAAVDAVKGATADGCGLVTLTGPFGVGKSVLLMAAVNDARSRSIPAVYTTATDLLDWLREAFDPHRDTSDGPDLSFERRWRILTTAQVLAIDELDEFNATPWAMERFLRLIDERWRQMEQMLTLCALNAPVTQLPGKVASRLRDARGEVVEIKGADMRRYNVREGSQ